MLDAALRPRAFPPEAGSLLPGLLAATRTGPTPAGDDELVVESRCQIIDLQQSGRTPEARRTLNGGPPASSARVASVTGANQVREDRRNRHAEAIRVGGRHDRGGDRESAPCADPGGARRARRGSS